MVPLAERAAALLVFVWLTWLWAPARACAASAAPSESVKSATLLVSPPGDESESLSFSRAISEAAVLPAGVTIRLAPGDYSLAASDYVDPTCGNCADPAQPVPATLGLRITGHAIVIEGAGRDDVRIHTHAGYGLLFEDCDSCRMSGVTVMGGERDTAGLATDAAVVVRRSRLELSRCRFSENIGDSAVIAKTVVGVMGVCGREGADIVMRDCEILRCSWDGIALYHNARATIESCVIDGIDRGAAGPNCGGRGVAIGLTWNARAAVRGNLITRYWKGIGIFVDAEADVRENIVTDCLTWGIALWDADQGTPHAAIEWNVVDGTGACGISVTRGRAGGRPGSRILHNAILHSGRNPRYDDGQTYCHQQALAVHATTSDVEIGENFFFENREPGDRLGARDMEPSAFRAAVVPLVQRLTLWAPTRQAEFTRIHPAP